MNQEIPNHLREQLSSTAFTKVRLRTYLALDVPTWAQAESLVDLFGDAVSGYKVGLELFYGDGPTAMRELWRRGKRIFLDIKLHDIPNTVAGAIRAVCTPGVEMVNVHTAGGRNMLEAAREAVDGLTTPPLLIGVTVLTSLDEKLWQELGLNDLSDTVLHMAKLCAQCGLDGVVTAATEVPRIRAVTSAHFLTVVPGIRPLGTAKEDQARSLTPEQALRLGADRLVLGRAVTRAADKQWALASIWKEMNEVLQIQGDGHSNP
ncbi:orotidine-5'-phosphate decarboxylase [Alicyclobacillaceae bacterium I2511]|nr:orotidine-5'-phosphate decarboxylase [Alicyclobacillaceae bacterium I2511]